jgi:hypothetical protein
MDLMNMSIDELSLLEKTLEEKLNSKLRNMKYDDELEEIYQEIEVVNAELKRRESNG